MTNEAAKAMKGVDSEEETTEGSDQVTKEATVEEEAIDGKVGVE